MPIYEYSCRNCGHEFEKLVRGAAASTEVECPECKSTETKKKLSTFAAKPSGGSLSFSTSAPSCSSGGT